MTPTQLFRLPLAPVAGWLELPCGAPGQGLAQARALALALPALAAVESWLAADLPCPEPLSASGVAGPAITAAHRSHVSLAFDATSALAGGRLLLPWSALKPGQPAPAGLPVQWPSWPARVCVQRLPAQRLAASGVRPGAVLLLPAAFQRIWQVQLQASGPAPHAAPAGWQVAGEWWPHESRVAFPGGPVHGGGDAAGPTGWSVWLGAPLSVDLRAWFGGGAPSAPLPAGQAELRWGDQAVSRGRLLPCGAGWGLRLEHVESLELAAAWT